MPDLQIDLNEVPNLPMDDLKRYYVQLFDLPAHSRNKEFYILRVSYRLQELRFGGLSTKTKNFLARLAVAKTSTPILPIGTEIVKLYHGKQYVVKILKKGVEWDGVEYKSLSSVAYRISGKHVSGNAFFGLKGR